MRNQFVGEAGPVIDEVATLFVQQSHLAGCHRVRLPGAQMVPMFAEQLQEQVRIDQIIFGATGVKGFPKTSHAFGVDRIRHDMFVLAEAGQERAAGLFEGEGNFAVGEARAQRVRPLRQGFRGLLQSSALDDGAAGGTETQGVFLVTPVQPNEGGIVRGVRRERWSGGSIWFIHNLGLCALSVAGTLAWTQRRPYSETYDCRHLSIRFESKRRAGAKLWANSSSETGCLFVIQRGVTAGLLGQRRTCTQKSWARRAKLFTVGCGESWRRLSSPPVNNFGPTIRVASLRAIREAKNQCLSFWVPLG